uniref:MULE transposase domain-containing protein n=1 Tax=Panagrolaimus davidi TaxID=227884 RepID=A0A914PUE7_9BILA
MVDIVNSARIDVPIVVQQALPNKQNLMRNGHRARQVANGFPAPPETLEELVIPEEFQNVTMRDPNGGPNRDEVFVVHDSGPQTGNQRFFIFSCAFLLNFLQHSLNLFLDGTFKTVPNIAYQLLVIHGQHIGSRVTVPCAYVMLNGKSREMYEAALSVLKRLVNNVNPETAMMDFEIAFHQAFNTVFPETYLSACFFHLCQSIRRKISELGLTVAVRNDHQLATSMAMFRALAFVPLEFVERAFVVLKAHLVETYSERDNYPAILAVSDYFEENYIGKKVRNRRNQPLFARELWNHVRHIEADIYDLRAGKAISRPMSASWARLQTRRTELVEQFDHNDILTFLRSMGGLLAAR